MIPDRRPVQRAAGLGRCHLPARRLALGQMPEFRMLGEWKVWE
jgi:hypothetical protein